MRLAYVDIRGICRFVGQKTGHSRPAIVSRRTGSHRSRLTLQVNSKEENCIAGRNLFLRWLLCNLMNGRLRKDSIWCISVGYFFGRWVAITFSMSSNPSVTLHKRATSLLVDVRVLFCPRILRSRTETTSLSFEKKKSAADAASLKVLVCKRG